MTSSSIADPIWARHSHCRIGALCIDVCPRPPRKQVATNSSSPGTPASSTTSAEIIVSVVEINER